MSIDVVDPFGAVRDPKMPFLTQALDPAVAQKQLLNSLGSRFGGRTNARLRAIRVTRWKPERRCLIEYDLEISDHDGTLRSLTMVGKARAKGADKITYQITQALRAGEFGPELKANIRVPEPLAIIPEFHMWLQSKESGVPATDLLMNSEAVSLCQRIGGAIYKLHQANVPTPRHHTLADELRILHERLNLVAQTKPAWSERLEQVFEGCARLAATIEETAPRGIHRDFYAGQVLVDGPRLCLLDFDCYCQGDPMLDLGNFVGHVTELSLRMCNDPQAWAHRESAFVEGYFQSSGGKIQPSVQAYATLTLARHIQISTLFPERQSFTERILELSEQRLFGADSVKTHV